MGERFTYPDFMASRRASLSIVTVWNDESVRRGCLDQSIEDLRRTLPGLEYLPVDNRGQRYPTAGAALNEGVRVATQDVVAFVQQDIYLHSLVHLAAAAALLEDPGVGLVGAVGVGTDGRLRGRIRDRVVLVGTSAAEPVRVDSLDEVLFLARRRDLVQDPLSQDPALAWHAYGVEYGLRQRAQGREVVATDIPLTHNSLSTNLARLDEAHAAVAAMHPGQTPVRTTCGTIRSSSSRGSLPPPASGPWAAHRWRYRWAKASWAVRAAGRAAHSDRLVLGDLRRDVDRIAAHADGSGLRIHNVTPPGRSLPEDPAGTRLRRASYDVWFSSGPLDRCPSLVETDRTCLVTNLSTPDLVGLRHILAAVPHVVGYQEDIGPWVLTGPVAEHAHQVWGGPRSRPARLPV